MNKKQNAALKLWAFYYNPMTWESSYSIISYHRTKKGSTLAMRAHKAMEKIEHDRLYKDQERDFIVKFGSFQSWIVERFDLIIED